MQIHLCVYILLHTADFRALLIMFLCDQIGAELALEVLHIQRYLIGVVHVALHDQAGVSAGDAALVRWMEFG